MTTIAVVDPTGHTVITPNREVVADSGEYRDHQCRAGPPAVLTNRVGSSRLGSRERVLRRDRSAYPRGADDGAEGTRYLALKAAGVA